MKLKPLSEQVVVITGASSGVGREAALRSARAGATIVAVARDEDALTSLVAEVATEGGAIRHVVCDVADREQVERAAALAEEWFGRIDTWVGNAGAMAYGAFEDTPAEDFRRMMDVNFLGQVHGAHVALPALRRAGGGALIAIASTESYLTLPMHSAYAASKAAVASLMDGVRREVLARGFPISVTTVFPAVMDTPGYLTTRNRMGKEPSAPPPYYDPAVAAECVLFAATHPVRHLYAGGGARSMAILQALAPRALDVALGRVGIRLMRGERPAPYAPGNLDDALDLGRVRGGALPAPGRRSVYTWLELHPRVRLGLGVGLAAAVAGGVFLRRLAR